MKTQRFTLLAGALLAGVLAFFLLQRKPPTSVPWMLGVLPLSGPGSEMGPSVRDGLTLFFETTPIQGKQFDIQIVDNKGNAKDGQASFQQKLAQVGHPPQFAFTQLSGVAAALGPSMDSNKIIQFALAASPSLLSSEYSIRTFASADRIGEETAGLVAEIFKAKSVVILALNDEYGRAVAASMESKLKTHGIGSIATNSFDAALPDPKAVVQAAISSDPQAIAVTGFGKAPIQVIAALKESGFKGGIVVDPVVGFKPYTKLLGAAAEGLWVVDLAYPAEGNSKQKMFTEAFTARFGAPPDLAAALAYAACEIYASACEKTSTLDSTKVLETLRVDAHYPTVMGEAALRARDTEFRLVRKKIVGGEAMLQK